MDYFKYGNKEMDYIKKKDAKLGKEIEKIGMIERSVNSNIFLALITSVIGQQISTKAATTVNNRLLELAGNLTPEAIDRIDLELIQQCGMSLRKASYIKGIARSAIMEEIDFINLYKLPDVLSYKDLGIRRGIMRLYGLEELSKKEFEVYKKRYSPYGTVASIYLWEISREK